MRGGELENLAVRGTLKNIFLYKSFLSVIVLFLYLDFIFRKQLGGYRI